MVGRPLAECSEITEEALTEALEVPPHKRRSPQLAVEALRCLLGNTPPQAGAPADGGPV
jgi:hypothetical protein